MLPLDRLHVILGLAFSAVEMSIGELDQLSPQLKTQEPKRGFGNLIIHQTCGLWLSPTIQRT